MADQQILTTKMHTDASRQMAAATGVSPLSTINRDLEEREAMKKAQQMGMNYVDISKVPVNPDHLKTLTAEEALGALALTFFRIGKKIRLAVAHPTQPNVVALIKKLKDEGYLVDINLASESGLRQALGAYERAKSAEVVNDENMIDEQKIASYHEEIQNLGSLREKIQSVTAEEALNFINVGAIKTGASDIHYQPEEGQVLVRFRIDGVLQEVLKLDLSTYGYIANQLKYKAGMRLNITNVPQDGRYFFKINKRKIDVRVSALPTEYGESFVCRLLDSQKKMLKLEDLGFSGRNLELLHKALTLENGMILVTGPTGSGKTTTLYTLLNDLNKPECKIITLEDPIEYHLNGITQSQINEKRSYTFASGLRAVLRQDPDIVMIGEIRDDVTAETAAQAALTGHVLLSTLHTNSAIETIPRLRNIGLKPYMIAPALSIVVAQRLVRRICPHCAVQEPISDSERKVLSAASGQALPPTLPHGKGCEKCSQTGFLGQVAIAEIFENTSELQQLILAEKNSSELLAYVRKQGMLTLAEDGVQKILQGLTTLSEVERVIELNPQRSNSDQEDAVIVLPSPSL